MQFLALDCVLHVVYRCIHPYGFRPAAYAGLTIAAAPRTPLQHFDHHLPSKVTFIRHTWRDECTERTRGLGSIPTAMLQKS